MDSFEINDVERFTVGTIGEPGSRVFLMQIEGEGQSRTLKTEKETTRLLADRLGALLDSVEHFKHLPEDLELRGPFDIAWTTGSVAAEADERDDKIRIEIWNIELAIEGEFDEERDSHGVIYITQEQAGAFAIRARLLVEAGRPPCPLCGYPLAPEGHACPRSNGHRPPDL